MLDEAAHLSTTALALDVAQRWGRAFRKYALLSSVLIDADHIPDAAFGWKGITRGVPRPYTHSLSTAAVVLVGSRIASTLRRPLLEGVAFGLLSHFLRDVTDGSGGAAVLWPVSGRIVKLPEMQPALLAAALTFIEVRCR